MNFKVADAHCDTLTKFNSNPFLTPEAHWNTHKFNEVNGYLQVFALFTPPELNGNEATSYVFKHIGAFHRHRTDNINLVLNANEFKEDKINIIFSIEGATPIQRDLDFIYSFYNAGVRAMGLTWNHRNFLADGIDEEFGLTELGKTAIKIMEQLRMIVDVSHLNVNGFNDVVKTINKPFIASHSNARAITNHPRNLYDDQIQEIKSRGGFIGLNFYSPFLSEEDTATKSDLIKHLEYFLNKGCEDILGFGADFDGIDKSPFTDATAYNEIYTILKDELQLNESTIEKIFYKNLVEFYKREL